MLDWTRYLESIRSTYARWWRVYTFTDVVGEVPQGDRASEVPLLDLGLMVETRVADESSPVPDDKERSREKEKKIERLGVLEGLRKYAAEHVLLVGRPGSGKSTALLRMLLEEVERVKRSDGPLAPNTGGTGEGLKSFLLGTSRNSDLESRSPKLQPAATLREGGRGAASSGEAAEISETPKDLKIPVLVELRYWQTSTLELIRRFLLRHGIALSTGEIEAELAQGRFLLLVDGINELPSEEARRNVKAFRRDYPRTPMVFTTRELGLGGDLEIGQRLEMQPLSEEQMRQFVLKYLPERGEEMWGQMGDRLRQLGETPLLLILLCSMLKRQGNIPNSSGLVFREFTQSYSRQMKRDAAAKSQDWWQEILQQLAWTMMERKSSIEFSLFISRREAEKALADCLQLSTIEARSWLEELLQHHLIQLIPSSLKTNDQVEFSHQLIQEYYAAEEFLQRLPNIEDEELRRRYLNYLKWTEPVALMLELVTDEALAMRVVERALEVDLRLGARLAGTVKPELQKQTVIYVDNLLLSAPVKSSLLGDIKTDAAVASLLEMLKNENSDIRAFVANALGRIKSDAVVSGLLEALKDEDFDIRTYAADALGEVKSNVAIDGLLEALKDENLFVRYYAAGALGKIQSNVAIDGLLEALKDEEYSVRSSAADSLGKIKSDATVDSLLEALKDENSLVRSSAAIALGKIKSDAAVDDLLEALKDKDSNIRHHVADALGEIQSHAAITDLLEALKDSNSDVRSSAATALGKIKSDVAVDGLLEALKDEDFVRYCAVEALMAIKSDAAIVGLRKALKSKSFDVHGHTAALELVDTNSVVTGLLEALKNKDSTVRYRAIDSLKEIQLEVIDVLLKALKDKDSIVRVSAIEALGKTEADVAVADLLEALEDESSFVRASASFALGKISSPKALSKLHELLPKAENLDLLNTIVKIQEKCQFYRYCPDDNRLMTDKFDVFISHNSQDKPLIRKLCELLRAKGVKLWFDENDIIKGDRFQVAIQQAIIQSKSAAICIGRSGLGPWQDEELDALIGQRVERKISIIPVLLPGVESLPDNRPFLTAGNAVKFGHRIDDENAIAELVEGIKRSRASTTPVRSWTCYHHFSVQSPSLLSRAFSSAINTLLYAPDGKTLLTSSEDWDNPIQLWNLETLATSPFASPNSPVQLWNLLNGQPSRPVGNWKLGRFSRLALSNDGKILAIGGTVIELWNLETGERLGELGSLFGHRDMSALAISPDNTLLATTSIGESPFNLFDYSIRLWDLTTLQPRHTLKGHRACVRTLIFTQDGQTLLSASQDGTIKSWDSRTGESQNTLSQPGAHRAIALSPDGEVAIGNRSSSYEPVNAIAFSPNGQHLATAQGGALTITNTDGEQTTLTDHSAKIRAIAFSPDSHHVASGDASGQVLLWRLSDRA